jgi:hypothetical protein
VTTRGVFHRQGPFVGSGGLYSPGPATDPPLLAMCRPLNDVLTSSWVSAGPFTFFKTREGRLSSTFFARHPHRRSHADDCALLGPRSLVPPPFLRALHSSVFGARMLPADFCNVTTTYGH